MGRRGKVYRAKLFFHRYRSGFLCGFVEFSSTRQDSRLSQLAAATINLDALKKQSEDEKKSKIQLWIFFQPKSVGCTSAAAEMGAIKILKQWKNLIFPLHENGFSERKKMLQSMQRSSKCHKNILMRYSRE